MAKVTKDSQGPHNLPSQPKAPKGKPANNWPAWQVARPTKGPGPYPNDAS